MGFHELPWQGKNSRYTICPPEERPGTLYKVTNWLPLGFTKGFKRHRRNFYQDVGKLKHLWIRTLKKDALVLLARSDLEPAAHQAALADGDTAGTRCALKMPRAAHSPQGPARPHRYSQLFSDN